MLQYSIHIPLCCRAGKSFGKASYEQDSQVLLLSLLSSNYYIGIKEEAVE
jgi:hypothetical protein